MSKAKQNEIKTAADLKQDSHNYRKHSETNKARIKKSIEEAGLGRSVVIDADGVLVAGNGVQQVIDKDTPVRVVETDGTELVVVKRTDLHTGDPRRKTLALADNATSDDVEWDFDVIEEDWTEDEAGEWGVEWPADEEEIEQKEAHEDDFDPDKPVETVCKKGDIWKLGNHRLMCGDSTDAGDVALLMDGEKADLFLTDPPYGVSYTDKNEYLNSLGTGHRLTKRIENDHLTEDDMFEFWKKVFANAYEATAQQMSYYVFGAQGGDLLLLLLSLKETKLMPKHGLVWVKNNHVLGRCDYNYKHEPITYGWKIDGTHKFYGGFQTSVLEFDKPLKSELHPTMKPVPLISKLIENSSKENDIVLDLFGGSGTTLIAAEQLNRKCYIMELDPHYCDVIIARWENLTGKKAEKLK